MSNLRYIRLGKTLLKYNIKTKQLQYIGEHPTISELVFASKLVNESK